MPTGGGEGGRAELQQVFFMIRAYKKSRAALTNQYGIL